MAARDSSGGGAASTLSRAEVRKLLDGALRTDTDLDVFAGDYCNDAYQCFTKGMLRPDKVTLLLDKVPVGYLVELLRKAHPTVVAHVRPAEAVPSGSMAGPASLPAKPARFIGRDELALELTNALLDDAPRPVVILGGAGIGKSTLTLAVLHRSEIAARYGKRRYFVRLDAATTADAMASAIAVAMRLPAEGDPRAAVLSALMRESAVLVLDNGETPLDHDRDQTEALLGDLASVPGLALVISVRGAAPPDGAEWAVIEVAQLDDLAALNLFCRIAPKYESLRDDPALTALMKELAGVPLAVTLLGRAAQGCTLRVLSDDWRNRRTDLLARFGSNQSRSSSWAVSVELSICSPRMTLAARQMASLLGVLPDGAAEGDLTSLLPKQGLSAARVLAQVGLAYFEAGRLLMLAPVREHIARSHPPARANVDRVMGWYGMLAVRLGDTPGRKGGKEALARLVPEAANLDSMIRRGLDGPHPGAWIDIALQLTQYFRFSVRPYPCPLDHALHVARSQHEVLFEARCLQGLGELALRRSDLAGARERYEAALALYWHLEDAQREANCLQKLGDLAFRQLRYDEAHRSYEEALSLFRRTGDALGEANCVRSFGDLAHHRSDQGAAQGFYEKALQIYQKVGDVLGEANSIFGLGNVMFEGTRYKEARDLYEKMLPLYRQVGDVRGEANCLFLLGNVAQNCSQSDEAVTRYKAAIQLYARVHEPCPLGMAHRGLARLEQHAAEKAHHVAAARDCWTIVDRHDLLAELDAEFPPAP